MQDLQERLAIQVATRKMILPSILTVSLSLLMLLFVGIIRSTSFAFNYAWLCYTVAGLLFAGMVATLVLLSLRYKRLKRLLNSFNHDLDK